MFIIEFKLANFAYDNTFYVDGKDIHTLIKIIERKSDTAVSWIKANEMIVNPSYFQAMKINIIKASNSLYDSNINN